MSSTPALTMISASPSFWQVMPLAPAAICILAIVGFLCVLMWGRLATPASSQAFWIRAMLRSTLSMSMTAQGVPYSRAILAARVVVMEISELARILFAKAVPTFAKCTLGLFNLFAPHFELQPFVLGLGQLLLRLRQSVGSLIEALAILAEEIGVVKEALLLGDLGLQLGDGLGQRFQRVLLVEGQPSSRAAGRRDGSLLSRLFDGLRSRALHVGAALGQHVGIAAGIFEPASVTLGHDHGRHHAVEKIAIVADQDHGALVVAEHFLEDVEGLEVEVVGRLVQHQEVGRFRQRACQHQPAALAARQHLQRRAHLFLGEQEVFHIAHDMLRLAADHNMVAAAAGERLGQRRLRIETFTMLVERCHLDVGAEPYAAAVRCAAAGQHLDQRGLAGAVRADDADAIAALDADREAVDDLSLAIGPADILGLDDELAGLVGLGSREVGVARRAAMGAALVAQRVEIAESLDVALAAARDAVTQPVLLVDDLAVELVLVALFLREHLVAPSLEGTEAAVDLPDLAAVEPGGAAREIAQEAPIMADDHQRAAAALKLSFQPFDGRKIQVVGRLVQQQDIGRGRQHARERSAARFAAGDMRRILFAAEPELFDQIPRLVMVIAGMEAGLDIGQRGGETGKIRLLRQVADGGAGLNETAAAIGFDQAGGDLEQSGFAGTVAADQADALAVRNRQFDTRQERRAAEGQLDVAQLYQRWRHTNVSVLS